MLQGNYLDDDNEILSTHHNDDDTIYYSQLKLAKDRKKDVDKDIKIVANKTAEKSFYPAFSEYRG